MSMGPALLEFFGRTHPMVLHLPIGMLAGLAALEGMGLLRRRPMDAGARMALIWLAAILAGLTAGTGWVLSAEPNGGTYLEWHRWLGVSAAGLTAATALALTLTRSLRVYGWMLAATLAVLVPAGHFGATLTHGNDFLLEPFQGRVTAVEARATQATKEHSAGALVFASEVEPILAARCERCHGPSRRKGGLDLSSAAGLKRGGRHGPVVVMGKPEASEIVRRMRLAVDDEDHMPPVDETQASEDEIAAVERWIRAGGEIGAGTEAHKASDAGGEPVESRAGRAMPAAATREALAALETARVHAAPIGAGLPMLMVSFAGAAKDMNDERAASLLEGVREQIVDVSLGSVAVGERTMGVLARAEHVARVNLSGCPVDDALLSALEKHPAIEELVLTRTRLGEQAAALLAGMPKLRRVYVWKAGLSPVAVAHLRAARPELDVNVGEVAASEPLEVEPALRFSSERPLPGAGEQASAGTGATPGVLAPGNSICPVSGKAVDPRYVILYEGKLIGFCCEKCAQAFWAEPEKYPVK